MSKPLLPFTFWVQGTDPEVPWNDNALRSIILGGKDVNNATTAQPTLTSPADDGKAYIIQSTHTGAQWASFTPKSVAIFYGGGWYEFTPVEGARISIGGASYIYTSGVWTSATSATARNTVSALATSGSVAIDYALGDYFTIALAGNVSGFTFSNLPGSGKGASLMIRFTQDATPRTVAWPASFKWSAAAGVGSVSTPSGSVDVLAITTFDNGTTWDATLAKAFA